MPLNRDDLSPEALAIIDRLDPPPPRMPKTPVAPKPRPRRIEVLGPLFDTAPGCMPDVRTPVLMCEGGCGGPTRHLHVGSRSSTGPASTAYVRFECATCGCERTWGAW